MKLGGRFDGGRLAGGRFSGRPLAAAAIPEVPTTSNLPANIRLYVPFTDPVGATTVAGYVGNGSAAPSLVADAMYANGNAVMSSAQSKFGSTSGYTPGDASFSAFVSQASRIADLQTGSDPWSIDFWFYSTNEQPRQWGRIVSMSEVGAENSPGFAFERFLVSSTPTMHFYKGDGINTTSSSSRFGTYNAVLPRLQWVHVYAAYDPVSAMAYRAVGGAVSAVSVSGPTEFNPALPLWLGCQDGAYDAYSRSVQGYFSELVIRSSIPWTSNFTPPTAPLI